MNIHSIKNNANYEFHFSQYLSILEKFDNADSKLDDILTINRGVNIGGCFHEFLSETPLTKDYKKYLSGTKCIKEYHFEWDDEDGYMIFDENKEKRLRESGKTMVLGRHVRFLNEKLFIPESGQKIMSAYCSEIIYSAYGLLVATSEKVEDLKYMCGLLNSKLFSFYCIEKEILRKGSKATPHVGVRGLNTVPVFSNPTTKRDVINLVDKILVSKNHDIKNINLEINKLIYKIYNLNKEQINIVNKYFE